MGTSNCRVPGPEAAVATRYYEGHRLSPGEMGSFMVCVLLQCPPSPWPLCHHLFFFFTPKWAAREGSHVRLTPHGVSPDLHYCFGVISR